MLLSSIDSTVYGFHRIGNRSDDPSTVGCRLGVAALFRLCCREIVGDTFDAGVELFPLWNLVGGGTCLHQHHCTKQ